VTFLLAAQPERARAFAVAIVVCQLGCAARSATPGAVAKSNRKPTTINAGETKLADASVPVEQHSDAADNGRPKLVSRVSSPCVLHAADAKQHTSRTRSADGQVTEAEPTGSCAANAECILMHGKSTVGDGFVSLVCVERSCKCSIDSVSQQAESRTLAFELATPCTSSSEALKMMVEHCMAGMTVHGRQ
jgi:hypothetical protein